MNRPQIILRQAQEDEYETVLDIQHKAYMLKEAPLYGGSLNPGAIEPLESLVEYLQTGYSLLVALINDRIVGSIRIQQRPDGTIYLCRLSVDPELQGKGIAQQIITAIEKEYPMANALALDVGDKSEENIHIYSKLGFVYTGESHQIENGPLCLEMRKQLR